MGILPCSPNPHRRFLNIQNPVIPAARNMAPNAVPTMLIQVRAPEVTQGKFTTNSIAPMTIERMDAQTMNGLAILDHLRDVGDQVSFEPDQAAPADRHKEHLQAGWCASRGGTGGIGSAGSAHPRFQRRDRQSRRGHCVDIRPST